MIGNIKIETIIKENGKLKAKKHWDNEARKKLGDKLKKIKPFIPYRVCIDFDHRDNQTIAVMYGEPLK